MTWRKWSLSVLGSLKAHLWESLSKNFKEIFPALISLIYLCNKLYKSCKFYTCICNRTEVIACQKLKKIVTNSEALKRLRWTYSNSCNSKSIWSIEVKFCTLPTDMFTQKLLNFQAVWRWSLGKLLPFWPISNGMTLTYCLGLLQNKE